MKNYPKKIFTAVAIGLFVLSVFARITFASEVTGSFSGNDGIVVPPPSADPVPGSYTDAQTVVLTAHEALSIHYTTDGTSANCTVSPVYTESITVSSTETISAISCYDGGSDGPVSLTYTIGSVPDNGGGNAGGGGSVGVPSGGSSQQTISSPPPQSTSTDMTDFNAIMADWGSTTVGDPADFNGDGTVDILDFNWLMVNWVE